MNNYKQVRPLAALAVLEMCVTMDSTINMPLYLCKAPISVFLLAPQQHRTTVAARIGAAKVQGFRKGDLV